MSACSSPPRNSQAARATEGSRPIERRSLRGSAAVNVDHAAATAPPGADRAVPATWQPGQILRINTHESTGHAAFKASDRCTLPGRRLPIRILVIDDDSAVSQMVVDYLEKHDMRAGSVVKRQDVMRRFANEAPDLVVLDLQLGREDGLDLLREIRSRSNVSVIVTIGDQSAEIDRVIALELGADDCLAKPFGLRELLARIRVILRRRETRATESQPGPRHCRFGGWRLDRRNRNLTSPGGSQVALTKGEYALLIAFLDAPMRPLCREHLLQATRVHGDVFDRSIDVQILRLRRKLETDASAPRIIRTERGIGYVFALPVEHS